MVLKDKVAALPDTPGVYRWFDAAGTIIYVGKAKNLRRRVSQYLRPEDQLDRKTRALVAHIADVDYTPVETEEDALLLENNLIKQLQPHYNILLKDSKTYPWICIRNEPFPRVVMTRRYVRDGSRWFGPYASVMHAKRLLQLIGQLYRPRPCRLPLTVEGIAAGRFRSCLNFQMNKCAGACIGLQSQADYDAAIEAVGKLLSGRVRNLIDECRTQMAAAASELRFEEAQTWKERLALLEVHQERQKTVGHGILDMETYRLLEPRTLPRRVVNSQKALSELQRDLGMEVRPDHIECFDNSNIQGTNPVAACVVFREGVPSKKDYRRFNIKTVVGANDFASMKEIVNRRYSRMLAESPDDLPQLVVVDGGKGQLTFALEALEELGLTGQMKVVGLAERLEEVIIPGDPHPLFLDKNSASLRILMQIRDEAHRFGITFHRQKRSVSQVDSALDGIPGIGPATQQKLLRHFKSLTRLKKASFDDVAALIGPAKARVVSEALSLSPGLQLRSDKKILASLQSPPTPVEPDGEFALRKQALRREVITGSVEPDEGFPERRDSSRLLSRRPETRVSGSTDSSTNTP